jgi:PKD repeat protein
LPVHKLTVNKSSQCFAGNSFAFTDSSSMTSGKIVSRLWDFGNGDTSSQKSHKISYSAPGFYNIRLILTTDMGCKDTILTKVRVYPKVTSAISLKTIGSCQAGNSFVFTDSSAVSSGSIASRLWDFGDNSGSTAKTVSHSFAKAGSYKVILSAKSDSGCIDTTHRMISVFAMPTPAIKSDSVGCFGNIQYFKTKNNTGSVYTWTVSGGSIIKGSGTDSILISWLDTGTGFIKVIEKNLNQCVDSAYRQLKIYNKPKAKFNAATNLCAGTKDYFKDSSLSAIKYLWSFGDGDTASIANPIHVYQSPGTKIAHLWVSDSVGCPDTNSLVISVKPTPNPQWFLNYFGNISYLHATDSLLTNNSYHWHFGDGDSATGHLAKHMYQKNKSYLIRLNVTNSYGCINEFDSTIKIIYSKIEPHLPGISGLSTFPNPFQSSATIQYHLSQNSNIHISIFDLTGKEVALIFNQYQNSGNYEMVIDAEKYHLKPGIYLLQFKTVDGFAARRLVKY